MIYCCHPRQIYHVTCLPNPNSTQVTISMSNQGVMEEAQNQFFVIFICYLLILAWRWNVHWSPQWLHWSPILPKRVGSITQTWCLLKILSNCCVMLLMLVHWIMTHCGLPGWLLIFTCFLAWNVATSLQVTFVRLHLWYFNHLNENLWFLNVGFIVATSLVIRLWLVLFLR